MLKIVKKCEKLLKIVKKFIENIGVDPDVMLSFLSQYIDHEEKAKRKGDGDDGSGDDEFTKQSEFMMKPPKEDFINKAVGKKPEKRSKKR